MKNSLFILVSLFCAVCNRSQSQPRADDLREMKGVNNTWVFIMAGQSNMAGRGTVESQDTIPEKRLLTINKDGQVMMAKEPLHFYEPGRIGLDCGYSFGTTLLKHIPDSISVLLVPCAVGGSSISQWLGDSVHRDVKLYSNFLSMLAIARRNGTLKGILWHQGETDANERDIPLCAERLRTLISRFRSAAGDNQLPVLIGELGSFSTDSSNWERINEEIRSYSSQDSFTSVITTGDLEHKGDQIHFDSNGQRAMGKRFAETYLQKFAKKENGN
ncbi:MAG TPA: sialate O-acetylesterase [Chitinophagaceae bacterium]|nr:sialate O-acetylesterase [Chitinophagaceae bacterium]